MEEYVDPNTALHEIRVLIESWDTSEGTEFTAAQAEQLVDLIDGLDNWITSGGFLPSDWSKK